MNATEARKLTEDNLTAESQNIQPYLDSIFGKIKDAAKKGCFSITHPFYGVRMVYPSPDQAKAIWKHLSSLGYEVIHHPNPDPGYPGSCDYTEIKWN